MNRISRRAYFVPELSPGHSPPILINLVHFHQSVRQGPAHVYSIVQRTGLILLELGHYGERVGRGRASNDIAKRLHSGGKGLEKRYFRITGEISMQSRR